MKKIWLKSVIIAGAVLLSAVISFMIKSGGAVAFNNDYMENTNIETLDGVVVIVDRSTVYESGYSDYTENIITEASSMDELDDVVVIMDYSTVFESE